MRDHTPASRPPIVLIASNQEWSSRSLETILAPSGYAVLRAYTAQSAIRDAASVQPELIMIDSGLQDVDALDVCRELRLHPNVSSSTPIVLISPEPPTRQRRIDALRAGAWEHLGQPLDTEEFLLRIEAYVRAKLDADSAREEGLVDHATGLYNMRGLARRARELGSEAARHHAPLACVVFAPEFGLGEFERVSNEALADAIERLTETLKASGRVSDAIGRLGPTEFAVVASRTDASGSVKLAERLAQAVKAGVWPAPTPPFQLRAGYYAIPGAKTESVDPLETILRATSALQLARTHPEGGWIRSFDNGGATRA